MVVAVIGLGFVGLTLSLALADRGVKVYGVETNPNTLKILSQGIPTFNENGIEHYLERNIGKNFQVFAKLDEFPSQPDTYVICVATPIFEGTPNMSQLKAATESVGKYFSGDELIIIRSTSPVGTTRKFILPILAEELQKKKH